MRKFRDDLQIFAEHFLKIFNTKFNRNLTGIQADDMAQLNQYKWKGDVKETEKI